jgi:hypothetical protein
MATTVSDANVLSLEKHGQRAREAVDRGLHGHLCEALEHWRQPLRGGAA